jgi:hypothetical protein
VTYGESRRLFGTPGLGYVDPTDPDALVWLVAYVGPMVSISADYCEWGVRAFRADARIGTDWSAASCGKGQWPSDIDLFPDRSWFDWMIYVGNLNVSSQARQEISTHFLCEVMNAEH